MARPASRVRCQLCDVRVEPWGRLRYARMAPTGGVIEARGLQHCSQCSRLGCPACLYAVEERVDDFFLDQFVCRECSRRPAEPVRSG